MVLFLPMGGMADELTPVCTLQNSFNVHSQYGYAILNNQCYFRAWGNPGGDTVFAYNGVQSPQPAPYFTAGLEPSRFIAFNNQLYFFSKDLNLYKYGIYAYDGVNPPVQISPHVFSRNWDTPFVEFNGKLYFTATHDTYGSGIWACDNTNAVTLITNSSAPQNFYVYDGKLFFDGYSAATGNELFFYDGVNPPQLAADLIPGSNSSNPKKFQEWNGKLYFWTTDQYDQYSLYSYGNNTAATIFVGNPYSLVLDLLVFNNHLYFFNRDEDYHPELWSYNGINPPVVANHLYQWLDDSGPLVSTPIVSGGKLYFSYWDFQYLQLWQNDASNSVSLATQLPYRDIFDYQIKSFFDLNGELYFFTTDELWRYSPGNSPISLVAPNGYERWDKGSTQTITWTADASITHVNIELSTDNGLNWTPLASAVPNSGAYPFTVPDILSTECLVKITDAYGSDTDVSSAVFTIEEAMVIRITSPNGGERVMFNGIGIHWEAENYREDEHNMVICEFSSDGGVTWPVASEVPAPLSRGMEGLYVSSDMLSNTCLVRVRETTGQASDTSDAFFSVLALKTLTILAPNGGESLEMGAVQPITWDYTGEIYSVKIEYTTNGGISWNVITNYAGNNGSYNWTVPSSPSTQCQIRISDADTAANDISDALFTISPVKSISLLTPNGGETPEAGSIQSITWNYTGTIPNVKLEYTTNGGTSWDIITASTANTGSYNWTVPNSPSTNCLVKVSDAAGTANDSSNSVFSILAARTITVLTPNGGETPEAGTIQSITWNYTGTIPNVKLEYTIDGGTSWDIITASTANTGSHNWTVPNSPSTNCLVKVSDAAGTANDSSNAAFTIATLRTLTVTTPNGGQRWFIGSTYAINWTSTGAINNVKIDYSSNSGSTWNTIVDSISNSGSYNWTIPNTPAITCLVRVSDAAGPATDVSNAFFTIDVVPTITVTAPNGGQSWTQDTTQNITWTYTGTIANVAISYSTNNGSTWNAIQSSTANTGSYSWVIPAVDSTTCLVKVSDTATSATDTSNSTFTLWRLPSLTVTAPNGGESWKRNTYKTITWTSTGNIATVKLRYTINGGTSWTTITTSTANSGSYSWLVPNVSQTKTACKVRIIANGVTAQDDSNANFTILK